MWARRTMDAFFDQRLIGTMRNFGYLIGDPVKKVAAVVLNWPSIRL